MEENAVERVQYSQWVNTDSANLQTHFVPVPDFLDPFIEYLLKLKLHDFITRQQATSSTASHSLLSQKKKTMTPQQFTYSKGS